MLRFAPSPTGDMHIGDLRVALFNYLVATQNGEDLMLRIEDTDKEKNIEGKDKEIQDILGLFNIEYNQVLFQSEYKKFHRRMAVDLLQKKNAFNCFCSEKSLDAKREAAKASKKVYHYDDTCQNLQPEQIIDNEADFVVRVRKPDTNVEFTDLIKGDFSFSPDDVDSFIIMDKDKNPAYNFACAVDDMLADISIVIRDEDHMSNTPKQIAIRHALGYDKEMKYAHLPIILNDNGDKMNKDDDASSIKWLLEEGFIPEAISNYLISIGNTTPKEIFTFEESKKWFNLSNISTSPACFDMETLRLVNREHLKMLENKELSRYVGFADDEIGALAKLYLEEASTLKELRSKVEPIFATKNIPDVYKEDAETLSAVIKNAPHFEKYDDFIKYTMAESGLEGENLLKPLRLLLSGVEDGPDMHLLYLHVKNYLLEIVK